MSTGEVVVRTLGLRLPTGHRIDAHAHGWHQLVYATEGVMSVVTPGGTWVVPSNRSVWIPARFEHSVHTAAAVRMQTLYVRPDLCERLPMALAVPLPETCRVLGVTPLVRELVLETMRVKMLLDSVPEHGRLIALLLDQLRHVHDVALEVRLPEDRRARRVAERAATSLGVSWTISDLARGSGASARTIERLFVRETGATFSRWLQRVRVLRALELLAMGKSVTQTGMMLGYESTSAFIAMFKRVLGTTPGRYFTRPGP